MTAFKGFETLEQAKEFVKNHGGILTYDKRKKNSDKLTPIGFHYMLAVELGGLDKNKYPYCVQWNERA